MPNHAHVMIEIFENHPLSKVIHSWKSYTAHKANEILKRRGRFWQDEYWDRFIRSNEHYQRVVEYIHNNPVKAGLIKRQEDWEFSSARYYKINE